ncbi:hypothetical protein EJB05_51571 [Eragrostis curvula]|uniref:Ubiquitin-like protease family profile domain-containing protein n=1 Tax=Eragrostis curvula TaxID=38414 RepID=A0A5J9SV57_9POAL|nr:hypothetical protein EJB05_51571 [Eragrostis curvula]
MPPRRSPRFVTPDSGSQLVAESALVRSTSPRRSQKPKKESQSLHGATDRTANARDSHQLAEKSPVQVAINGDASQRIHKLPTADVAGNSIVPSVPAAEIVFNESVVSSPILVLSHSVDGAANENASSLLTEKSTPTENVSKEALVSNEEVHVADLINASGIIVTSSSTLKNDELNSICDKLQKTELPKTPTAEGTSLIKLAYENANTDLGIQVAFSYASESPSTKPVAKVDASISIGASTLDLKNRKKRKVVAKEEVEVPFVLTIGPEVESFYLSTVRLKSQKWSKTKNISPFVSVLGFDLSYDEFRDSLKPRAELSDRVMSVYAHTFNWKAQKYMIEKCDRKKISFSHYSTKKLLVKPECFQSSGCVRELKEINGRLKITSADLLFFPVIIQGHWILICVNLLYKTMNFFDSAGVTQEKDSKRMLHNLATNFSKVCLELPIFPEGFIGFDVDIPRFYPKQPYLLDCGFYCILYMICWDGKLMKEFEQATMVEYRKIVAYDISFTSESIQC